MANKKAKGKRANTRHNFKGEKLSVERLLKEFSVGTNVVVKANGTYHSALPYKRIVGHVGIIEEKVGATTYLVKIVDSGRSFKVGNAHLKELVK